MVFLLSFSFDKPLSKHYKSLVHQASTELGLTIIIFLLRLDQLISIWQDSNEEIHQYKCNQCCVHHKDKEPRRVEFFKIELPKSQCVSCFEHWQVSFIFDEHEEEEVWKDETSKNAVEFISILYRLDNHDHVLPGYVQSNHMLQYEVQMKSQYWKQQKILKVRAVLWEIVSIHNFAGAPVISLANYYQCVYNQITNVFSLRKVFFTLRYHLKYLFEYVYDQNWHSKYWYRSRKKLW